MATTPTVGAHYYLADATTPVVYRYLASIKGSALLVAGDDYVVAEYDNLVQVPTTSKDVIAWLKKADKALESADVDGARALLGSVLQWAKGIPAEG